MFTVASSQPCLWCGVAEGRDMIVMIVMITGDAGAFKRSLRS